VEYACDNIEFFYKKKVCWRLWSREKIAETEKEKKATGRSKKVPGRSMKVNTKKLTKGEKIWMKIREVNKILLKKFRKQL
jgi:hypothetical protein